MNYSTYKELINLTVDLMREGLSMDQILSCLHSQQLHKTYGKDELDFPQVLGDEMANEIISRAKFWYLNQTIDKRIKV